MLLTSLGGGIYYAGDDSVYTYLHKKADSLFPQKNIVVKPKPSRSDVGSKNVKPSSSLKYTFFDTLVEPDADYHLGLNSERKTRPKIYQPPPAPKTDSHIEQKQVALASSSSPELDSTLAPEMEIQKPYMVQVGSFRERGRAQEIASRLNLKGYSAFLLSVEIPDKGTWHRVYLGRYSTRNEAKQAAGKANISENLPAVVRQTS